MKRYAVRKLQEIGVTAVEQYNALMEEPMSEPLSIAGELHDTLLQSIHGLQLRFDCVCRAVAESYGGRPMQRYEALDDARIVEGRNRVQVPQGETDGAITLSDLLVNVANDVRPQAPPIIQITEEGRPHLLRPVVLEELHRICREAMVNAVNHAEASRIDVGIIYGRKFLEVGCHDNGRGIPRDMAKSASRKEHWGLLGMNTRARSIGAQFQIWSIEGKGTDVEIRLPAAAAYIKKQYAC
jgi:signal transduction histidine kinase